MSRLVRESHLPRNDAKANEVLNDFTREWSAISNYQKQEGCIIRHRNRLVKEAGYSYNDAYDAVHKIAKR